jgi:hypothetical protein
MTQDEIDDLARQARNIWSESKTTEGMSFFLNTFAKLVEDAAFKRWAAQTKLAVQDEREACAVIAEKQRYAMNISLTSFPAQNGTAVGIANQIRARGEA